MKQNTPHTWPLIALLIGMTFVGCGGSTSPEPDAAASPAGRAAADTGQPASVRDRTAVVQRLRTELAILLKQDAGQLPIDEPVTALGATDLTIVEWQMAAERTFRVDIANDKLFDPESKGARKTLTIASMAEIVEDSPQWPQGRTR